MLKHIALFSAFGLALLSAGCPKGSGTGTLAININGIPGDAVANVQITGGQGFDEVITANATLTVPSGVYTIKGADAVSSDLTTYTAVVIGSPATVSDGATTTVSVVYSAAVAPTTGTLQVNVSGLPAGTTAAISITGPSSFTDSGSATHTVPPGTYSVTAANVVSGSTTYTATVTGSPATVALGSTTTVTVVYAALVTTGTLQVNVSGLPAGTSAAISITGPSSFTDSGSATHTVPPGTYSVTAANVVSGSTTYTATITGSPATVALGSTTTVAVVYAVAAATGTLQVNITGGEFQTGAVSVSGPNGYTDAITATTTTLSVAPGSYTVSANNIVDGGITYGATITGSPASVSAGATTTVTVAYAQLNGSANVVVTFPGGAGTGQTYFTNVYLLRNGFGSPVTGYNTTKTVPVATYTITANPVTISNVVYSATVTNSPFNVTANSTTVVNVDYEFAAPAILSVAQDYGFSDQYNISIFGTGFASDGHTVANIDGVPCTGVTIAQLTMNRENLQCTVPTPHAAGFVDVTVTTTEGTTAVSPAFQYEYWSVDYYPLVGVDDLATTGGMTLGPDNNIWFVDRSLGYVGTVTSSGTLIECALPTFLSGSTTDPAEPTDIATGTDGNLWIADYGANVIYSMSPTGFAADSCPVTEYSVPIPAFHPPNTRGGHPWAITSGPDGNIWFTLQATVNLTYDQIGTIQVASSTTTAYGTITEYPLAAGGSGVWGITTGPDGRLWFGYDQTAIGTITTDGTISFNSDSGGGYFLTTGPDGNIWYLGGSYLGMMTPNGVATVEPGAGVGSPQAVHIASDPRGAVWFGGNQLHRYDTALLTDRNYPVSASAGVVVAPDGTIWSMCVEPSGQGLTAGLNAICRLHI